MQRVVDDVLGEFEVGIEDVIPGRPTGFDAIGGGNPLPTGGECGQALEVFFGELARGVAIEAEAEKCRTADEEAHRAPRWCSFVEDGLVISVAI